MNREILFKGFRPCENGKDRVFINDEWIKGEWIEGNGINQQIDVAGNKHVYIALSIKSRAYPPMTTVEWTEVIHETVGQYTGLTDKNGKKIFEGDIVLTNEDGTGVVTWDDDDGMFTVNTDTVSLNFGNYWACEFEVIGNIHDNPELIKNN